MGLAEAHGLSSWHLLFPDAALRARLEGRDDLMIRQDIQFHWRNRDFADFDDFLASLRSRRRKNMSRERRVVAEQGVELMKKGVWIIMFPEGTRTERGKQGTYKSGATRLAVATDAMLIPIAVSSGRCWPRRTRPRAPSTRRNCRSTATTTWCGSTVTIPRRPGWPRMSSAAC